MTHWNTKDKPREPVRMEVADDLQLTPECSVTIDYEPYKSATLFMSITNSVYERLDKSDRDGTRRRVLRELLPLAEAALVALRQAVAESEPQPEPTDFTDIPDAETLDMVGFANDLLREHRQPEGQ